MKKQDVIDYFDGKIVKVAEALGITHSAVCQWKDQIPKNSAQDLALLTDGKERNQIVLKYDPTLYGRDLRPITNSEEPKACRSQM